MKSPRYRLQRAEGAAAVDLARAVGSGLSATPKSLPCRFFYDAVGSRLFEEICELPEYYLTRAEDEILAARADEIAASVPPGSALVELGSGNAQKTRRVIEACLRRAPELVYVPIDIAPDALEASSHELLEEYPGLMIEAIAAEYADGLRLFERGDRPLLVLSLGSNIGNFDREEAAQFLSRLAVVLSPADRLLVGIDLRKSALTLEAAYDDARGVTARFNLHLLERINAELGGHFDIARFRHVAFYDDELGRIEMHLESTVAQEVEVDALRSRFSFRQGERIHTENSYKYSPTEVDALARASGLVLEHRWTDAQGRFQLSLLSRQ